MELSNTPYEDLANAIVIQAAKDYRASLKRIRKAADDCSAKAIVLQIEKFFRSKWLLSLTEVSGEMLIERIRGEEKVYDG